MLIAVVSDSHGDNNAIKKALGKIKRADYLFHLGDNVKDVDEFSKAFKGKIINVKGNCDFLDRDLTKKLNEKLVEVEGVRVFATHGHKYSVKENLLRLRYKAMEVDADIVLFGHTHMPCIEYEDGIWFINPGSIALSRVKHNTLALIELLEGRIIPYIIEI
ncbi:metallophosphoesterase [Hathewaya histolytica]|uniref:Phosphoesterase n=1 Tax=Hathewaya histolytica TaxID=1498 RepID=A0A4U9R959_HATHI|nr:metallophosphoesterase [Hathewaya histolytica]VTQ85220.1 phosphoesterase [Hathewaya histolytica]